MHHCMGHRLAKKNCALLSFAATDVTPQAEQTKEELCVGGQLNYQCRQG